MDSLIFWTLNDGHAHHCPRSIQPFKERTMTLLAPLSLVAATLMTGMTAGVFALYADTIMPGLRTTDDRTFVTAFTAIDRAIINPWFMALGFVGALVCTAVAVYANLHRPALPWVAAALGLYLIAFIVTVAVHVPLNDAIKAAATPGHLHDLAAARDKLHVSRWVSWNYVRVVTSVGASGCLAWALVLCGRASA
jgi:uncharacterized membrane protein